MNYPYKIPGAQTNPNSFVADNTFILGTVDKFLDARTQISVDYSALIPAVTLVNYSFKVKPGGDPQLWIDGSALNTSPLLTFYLNGGIAGRAYEVTINMLLDSGEIRSDVLTVQMFGDDCGCAKVFSLSDVIAGATGAVSGDGALYVNSYPRFFVSVSTPVGARVLDRWYNLTNGNIYDYVSNGITSWWEEATIGGGGGYGANVVKMNSITPDGFTVQFTLTAIDGTVVDIQSTNSLLVSVDGVWQEPVTQYAASIDVVEFVQAPFVDSVIFMLWMSPPPPTPPSPLAEQ
jgi:hypothetical protein